MKQITLRLPDELFEAVEKQRGLVPRETWIKDKLAVVTGGPVPPRVVRERDAAARERKAQR